MDALPQLYDPSTTVMTSDPGSRGRGQRDLAGIDQDVARAIATSSVFGPRDEVTGAGREYDPVARVSVVCFKMHAGDACFGDAIGRGSIPQIIGLCRVRV